MSSWRCGARWSRWRGLSDEAKLEAADPSVSLDLMVKGLIRLGATRADIARFISRRGRVGAV